MQKYVLLIALVAASAAASQSYKGYRVIQAEPQDDVQAEAVRELETWSGVDMWSRRVEAGDTATLMVAPGWTRTAVRKHLEERNVPHTVSNEDVQSMVDREASEQRTARLNRASVGEARFDAYMRYEEIQKYLQRLEDSYFGVSLINIGKSHEGRNLTVIRIGEKATKAKNAIFIDAGIHAREWIAPATALYIIHQLVENRTETRNLILDLDWYILPVANPDGYEYSHSKNRMWRKNRGGKNDNYLSWLWNFVCGHGVDLNRNFGFHYGESGVSSFQCSEIYAGKGAFSEVESQAMRDFILTLNADKSVKMYIALHSYGPMILYPWGYSTSAPEPSDTKKLIALATEANAAMVAAGSTPFKVQNSAKLYAAAGASDDWAKGGAGIEMSFTIELHGGGLRGFDLPVSKITDSVKQAFEGIRTLGFNARFIS